MSQYKFYAAFEPLVSIAWIRTAKRLVTLGFYKSRWGIHQERSLVNKLPKWDLCWGTLPGELIIQGGRPAVVVSTDGQSPRHAAVGMVYQALFTRPCLA